MIFEKFNRRYIEFVDTHFNINDHVFYIIGTNYAKYDVGGLKQVVLVNSYPGVVKMFLQLICVKKIFLHGLWHRGFLRLLLWQPWLIPKCYWMMWGGDFYYYDKESGDKKKLIRKLRHFISLVEGDYELAKQWYGARGEFHRAVLYSYLDEHEFGTAEMPDPGKVIRILVGNSADPSNQHLEVFDQLLALKQSSFELYVPLSYGNNEYAQDVISKGKAMFGERFQPLTGFLSIEQYRSLLADIDIAIFNHRRQQGLGNIIALLAKGKKVYLRPEVTTWSCFTDLGIHLFDTSAVNLELLSKEIAASNISIMRQHFSVGAYQKMLKQVFYS